MNRAAPDAICQQKADPRQPGERWPHRGRHARIVAGRNAGSAMNTRKKTTPATVIVAA
jgi:hypothetical protein